MSDLAAEVEPWLQQCGACDAGLMMGCTCPQGDHRTILLKVWRAYEASRKTTADEIARAIESAASDTSYSEPEAVTEHLLKAAQTAWAIGGKA